ncbi:winged helix-turn-helix transcriptional regulator [Candidatus Nitronereus thalassa]|uniref:Winged helix-turn-helix transcriptional regulator n=1 Tax=Candidatus Nitronereus thalassa TaxID=3020898 RepID=A0ABU3K5N3_9BACT|nr:winged helix-turn-helix transcriptional regulator [Candidatus Nitronereus thalassa]MDT7041679.1 winged helix-turn-helix transcriptional regulator [Candidatus Nitronereus thalassa]
MQCQRELYVLQEIEKNPVITQRSLASKLGVALGLTNLYIKRLAHKGYIKITTVPRGRIKYLITPKGIAEKSRLTCEYIQCSLTYFRDVRQRFDRVLMQLKQLSVHRIMIYGVGELAELAYLSLQGTNFTFLGFISENQEKTFLSCPCHTIDSLKILHFDAVLICHIVDVEGTRALFRTMGIPHQKVFSVV